jgi:hypothetical protein
MGFTVNITAVTALLAAVLPVTSAVQGCFEKRKQLALEELKEKQEISNRYLDRIKDRNDRPRTLRFLMETASDSDIRSWARTELTIVTRETDALVEELKQMEKNADEAEDAYKAALAKGSGAPAAEVDTARRKAERSRKKADSVSAQLYAPPVSDAQLEELKKEAERARDERNALRDKLPQNAQPLLSAGSATGSGH